jgi:hypothetical protein
VEWFQAVLAQFMIPAPVVTEYGWKTCHCWGVAAAPTERLGFEIGFNIFSFFYKPHAR